MRKKLAHFILSKSTDLRTRAFLQKLESCKETQTKKFHQVQKSIRLSPWSDLLIPFYSRSPEELQKVSLLTDYSFYRDTFTQLRHHKNLVKTWVPTSGSTEDRKWIPYTNEFVRDLSASAAILLSDVYSQAPATKAGAHYWSLSWLPNELRGFTSNDDSKILPWWQQAFMGPIKAVPGEIELAPTSESAWTAVLIYLMSRRDLSFVSVWSPTYWINVCDDIWSRYDELEEILETKKWQRFTGELESLLPVPKSVKLPRKDERIGFFKELWPNLAAISQWDSSTSKTYAEQVKIEFPHLRFFGKGLWSTEGVVTLPCSGKYPLAIDSHYFEFQCESTKKIFLAWQLQKDQIVQPLLSTNAGLIRYQIFDRLKVTDFLGSTPCFEFLGRQRGIDLVGEKMDLAKLDMVREKVNKYCQTKNYDLSAEHIIVESGERKYILALFGENRDSLILQELSAIFEMELNKSHHYQLARELGQLKIAGVTFYRDRSSLLKSLPTKQIIGQQKIETVYIN